MHLYFVDGHNLILGTRPLSDRLALDGRRASRDEAEDLILGWAEREGSVEVRLIYDGREFETGHPGNRDAGPLAVRFTDPPAEADDRIVFEASREAGAGLSVTVVTGDQGIRNRLNGSRVRFLDGPEYFRLLTAPSAEPRKEERFTGDERRALGRELRAHAAAGHPDGDGPNFAPPAKAAPPPIPPKSKNPPVIVRPGKEDRREAFRKRAGRRAGGKGPKAKSRKKRRGF